MVDYTRIKCIRVQEKIQRAYGREMHVLTILQRTGEVDSATLNVLNTVWNRLKGTEGATFARLTANIWKESPTIVDYGETAKKKATLYAVKLKGLLAIASEWEYDGQGAMAQVKDYHRKPQVKSGAVGSMIKARMVPGLLIPV